VAVAVRAADPDLGRLYHDTRERLVVLLSQLDEAALATRVPACPAWLVRDVVAHLCAVNQDVLAGRQTRINTDAETAAQVARRARCPPMSVRLFPMGRARDGRGRHSPLRFGREVRYRR